MQKSTAQYYILPITAMEGPYTQETLKGALKDLSAKDDLAKYHVIQGGVVPFAVNTEPTVTVGAAPKVKAQTSSTPSPDLIAAQTKIHAVLTQSSKPLAISEIITQTSLEAPLVAKALKNVEGVEVSGKGRGTKYSLSTPAA